MNSRIIQNGINAPTTTINSQLQLHHHDNSAAATVLRTPELILHIFNFLPTNSLLNVRNVCKQWRELVNLPHRFALYINQIMTNPPTIYVLKEKSFDSEGHSNKTIGVYLNELTALNAMIRHHREFMLEMEYHYTSSIDGPYKRSARPLESGHDELTYEWYVEKFEDVITRVDNYHEVEYDPAWD
ncbi:12222_t:CDS:2 [Ambispora leptoticha]|uniref:12222_t:CDS:1 n=1 Tax=Ambispora leptoticha TaxID=144679 RepID=A0A9N9B7J6_9GLOM|nr:12222_t:CDS:2 [Ambispora leptoticha]